MNRVDRIAVCSRSFSQNKLLREELLRRYQNVSFNDTGRSLDGDDLVRFLDGHEKAIIALEKIDHDILRRLPELRRIAKYGVGLDSINIDALRQHKVTLGWQGGVNRRSVSELVISVAIALLRHVPIANAEVRGGGWRQHVGGLLSGRTIGIVGCGFIGKDLVKLLQPWNCKILANDILDFPEFYAEHNVRAMDIDSLLESSDIVTLHVPLNASTANLLNAKRLDRMKRHSILINAARGGLVDELHLKKKLKDGHLAAAAFDVFTNEPPHDLELLSLSNFLATPHIGGSAQEVILEMGRSAILSLDENDVL